MRALRYLRYVLVHKWWVAVAGVRVGVPLWRLVVHDWSKFLPSEFGAYARYFDPTEHLTPQVADRFEAAWLKHIHRNDHHWQHWVTISEDGKRGAVEMPRPAMLEMVADWQGMSRALRGEWNASKWYLENQHRMRMHPLTRLLVERLLVRLERSPRVVALMRTRSVSRKFMA